MIDPSVAVVEVVDGIRSQNLTEEQAQAWFALMRRTAQESDACICPTAALARRLRGPGSPPGSDERLCMTGYAGSVTQPAP
jgi:hypothetical protein